MTDRGVDRVAEWRRHLTIITCGVLLFLLVSGLLITFLPFSLSSQFMVIFHTGVGLAFIPMYAIYQVRHWLRFRAKTLTNIKFLGYSALTAVVISVLSGVWVTWEAAFGSILSPIMDNIHLIASIAGGAILIWHLFVIIRTQRAWPGAEQRLEYVRAHRAFGAVTTTVGAFLILITLAGAWTYRLTQPDLTLHRLPKDYVYKYGDDPFAPSLAMTAHGGSIDPRLLAHSERCGTSGCHEQIVEEWLPSAHRYSSMDAGFQAIQHVMAANEGPESTRYCAGCHDPIALFSGSKNLYDKDLTSFGADEGISCNTCHSIIKTDIKGNANYVLARPEPYAFWLDEGPVGTFLSSFLIRAYPGHHLAAYKRELYKTPEFCGACHKQFIDKEINKVGWVQLQNQYDNWKASLWNRSEDPSKRITCNECHMRLVDSRDPSAGDDLDYNRSPHDGKHRHHGFIAANLFMPKIHHLKGAEEHDRLIEEWLRGETVIPEIADKWRPGPVVSVKIETPKSGHAGKPLDFQVVVHNNKVGHDFPTGPLDVIQAWVEVVARDSNGREVFRSGTPTAKHYLPQGTFVFKAEGIDREGNLIDRHNLWEMVGARFKRALFPDYSDVARYELLCPSLNSFTGGDETESHTYTLPVAATGKLDIRARLLYRKFDQFLLNYIDKDTKLTAPITEMALDHAEVEVLP